METIVSKEKFINSYRRKFNGVKVVQRVEWLPLFVSNELAELAGHILSDGSIEHSYSGAYRPKRVDFISPNKSIQQRIIFILYKIFEVRPKRHYFRNTLGLRLENANLARVLWLCGIPMGDRVNQEYDIPSWIKNGAQNMKSSFLRAYFDGDGSKPYKMHRSKASFGIRLTLNKTQDKITSGIKFLNSIKKMLGEFEIESLGPYQRKICYRGNGTKTIMLEIVICRQNSILNFQKYINFNKPERQRFLNDCVQTIISNYNPRK